jgi:hypothetical protein
MPPNDTLQNHICLGYAEYYNIRSFIVVPENISYEHTANNNTTVNKYTTLKKILGSSVNIRNNIQLDNLYALPHVRNLNLYDFLKTTNGSLLAKSSSEVLLPSIESTRYGNALPLDRDAYYLTYMREIMYIRYTYPNLFAPPDAPVYNEYVSYAYFTVIHAYNVVQTIWEHVVY